MIVKSTDHQDILGTQVDKTAKMVKISAILQITALARVPTTELRVVETQPHLMQRRMSMVAKGLCDVTPNQPFTSLVAKR